MHYLIASWTHKNTDIKLREKLALNDEGKQKEILRLVCANSNISEAMALSTCNRVEIIVCADDIKKATKHIFNSLSLLSQVSPQILQYRATIYENEGAVHHLFSVASSLDSLVVGENQIPGQLKKAFKFAYNSANAAGEIFSLIHFALKTAANVKNLTQISKNPVSVSSVAVIKAKQIYEQINKSLNGANALVIGAGQMASLVCKHLIANNTNITLVNRTAQKAQNLAQNLNGVIKVEDFLKLDELLNSHRLIFVATSACEAIIKDELIRPCEFRRYIFDICVPRNVALSEQDNVEVFFVDDLDEIVRQNLELRQDQANEAYAIVRAGVVDFYKWLKAKNSAPAIKALRDKARQVCAQELKIAIKKGYLKKSDEIEAKKLLHQAFKAFLHSPSVALKTLNDKTTLNALETLFDRKIQNDDEIV